jgi:hypothetical protein
MLGKKRAKCSDGIVALTIVYFRDHVEWDQEQEQYAQSQIEKHLNSPVPAEEQGKKDDHYRKVEK